MAEQTRYIFISGGVISGLGKGVVAASLGMLLKDRGYAVEIMKADAYLNEDAGTMNPVEHGEVFVTRDGLETDQDLGHYERFLNQDTDRKNYLTLGMVLRELLDQERNHGNGGKTVEMMPHIPEAVIKRVEACGKESKADFVICEFGGTVGEYQIQLFLEAGRLMAKRHKGRVAHVHVVYVPFPEHLGELKSKPAQLSIRALNEAGIDPDFLVVRTGKKHPVDKARLAKIAQNSNLDPEDIIAAPDVDTIYEVPLLFHEQKLVPKLLRKLGITVVPTPRLKGWKPRVERLKNPFDQGGPEIRIGVVAKYLGSGDYSLPDSYVSVLEAIKHCEAEGVATVQVQWIDAEDWEKAPELFLTQISHVHGLIIPQGWGSRGAEGKIRAIQYAREEKIPYLGLCYGFQMAAIEYARNVLELQGANSEEVDLHTYHPVIAARRREGLRGALRVGDHAVHVRPNTRLRSLYGAAEVRERHRHRYHLDRYYWKELQEAGLVLSASSLDDGIETVEAIELPDHPFFVGVQSHPEYRSRFEAPHPLFRGFLRAAVDTVTVGDRQWTARTENAQLKEKTQ